ncbi:MAG: hypothetical protein HYW70_00435 [Candidatus Nealsonbacteria bacterium]|nr:hypothetical protein [Candidatus Nealsonbacteria bacterium]
MQKGVSLYLTVILMSIIMATALGISSILISQLKTIRDVGNSVSAFFAADTGIEKALLNGQSVSGVLSNGAAYSVVLTPAGGSCSGQNYCLKSQGEYRGTIRAVEIMR